MHNCRAMLRALARTAASTIIFALLSPVGSSLADEHCPPSAGAAIQILGSGGPIADDGRASSGYLLWLDGSAIALIDAGGGTFLRFGEAKARFADLEVIALSHFHADHSADLPALLKSGYFSRSARSLTIVGPSAGGPFPGLSGFLESLLHPDSGAFRYLSGYLDGGENLPRLVPEEIARDAHGPVAVPSSLPDGVALAALAVPHGIVPALAFRFSVGERTVVFGGDQNGTDPAFGDFARNADLLVMHLPIPVGADRIARRLHADPGAVGRIAADAGARRLVLSHFMARSLRGLDANLQEVRRHYKGEIVLAEDLACLPLENAALEP